MKTKGLTLVEVLFSMALVGSLLLMAFYSLQYFQLIQIDENKKMIQLNHWMFLDFQLQKDVAMSQRIQNRGDLGFELYPKEENMPVIQYMIRDSCIIRQAEGVDSFFVNLHHIEVHSPGLKLVLQEPDMVFSYNLLPQVSLQSP